MATRTMRRRSPRKSPEQVAAEVAALREKLNDAIESLVSADGWRAMLRATMANLGRYSANNIILILAQCPHATQVRSAREWNRNGRLIIKGQKALRIFAPMTLTKKDSDGNPVLDESGREQKRTLFKTVPVFDISQTRPMDNEESAQPETEQPVYELGGKTRGAAPAELWERLEQHAEGHGYTVRLGVTAPADGFTRPATREVVIQESDPEAHRALVLAHEVAHIECGHVEVMDEYQKHRGRMECEAESVAYIVAGAAGMDAALTSVPYIATWAGKTAEEVRETLAAASETVVRAARAILATTAPTVAEGEAEYAAEEAAGSAYQAERAEMIKANERREAARALETPATT
ncbi:ArdC-like ssDNA-binding domain-containing protein [Streptomyces rubradiris]|uniref:ImmA/IrrE family metallo-endopeptidase n=1 Tax=Streptomyces rubradiris TaxID=285531 RepID=A0ABQ3RAH1_STRRR|nr:ImmA/IrrE family metallo-endopeptidase [Streptomyces rubradiris]GHH31607.1 hypothetical protein GCM10018792_79450 [Streptomyces rubradiris]GHI52853.1 hypothetical protein Srubr_26990 [Streptomyces rubradiris]